MPSGRRLSRKKRDTPKKQAPEQSLAPEDLEDISTPLKRLFPWDFPGQIGYWPGKRVK